jgi:hypothetical protein
MLLTEETYFGQLSTHLKNILSDGSTFVRAYLDEFGHFVRHDFVYWNGRLLGQLSTQV